MLEQGKSKKVISANIGREIAAGKPKRQAVAIALHEVGVPRKGAKKSAPKKGGKKK